MPFLPTLSSETTLFDVFKRFPATALPLLEYHEVLMRGASPLSVAERELIAAYVSGLNSCQYCHGVHAITAGHFGVPESLLQGVLDNSAETEMDERLRPLLAYVKKLTLTPSRISPEDAEQVFAAGWNEQALYDAVSVCALFNFMNRLVEGLGIKENPSYSKLAGERLFSGGYLNLAKLVDRQTNCGSSIHNHQIWAITRTLFSKLIEIGNAFHQESIEVRSLVLEAQDCALGIERLMLGQLHENEELRSPETER